MHDNRLVHPPGTLSPGPLVAALRPAALLISAILSVLLLAALPCGVHAESAPQQLIVSFESGTSAREARAVVGNNDARAAESLPGGMLVVDVEPGHRASDVAAQLERTDGVRYATPNHTVSSLAAGDDPLLAGGQLWGLLRVHAPEAWSVSTGAGSVVAVLDGGVNLSNPDLAANLWVNPGEIPGNGIDDDNDGFVDNVHGADWIDRDGHPQDPNGHGTHVAGTIAAAAGNGVAGAGVAPGARLMALRFLDAAGNGTIADAVEAIDFAIRHRVDVINASWGGPDYSPALRDALARAGAAGITVVAAAGNNGRNSSARPVYPAALRLANLVSVTASDRLDALPHFANYGSNVALAAPGVGIFSTVGSGIGAMSGTSMAAPHVAGIAALVRSWRPGLGADAVAAAVVRGTRQSSALSGKVASGGVADAAGALSAAGATAGAPPRRGVAPRSFKLRNPGKRVRIKGRRGVVRFSWSRAVDQDLIGYDVIVAGKLRAHVRSTHARIRVPAGRLSWRVVAIDAEGNSRTARRSAKSSGRIFVLRRKRR